MSGAREWRAYSNFEIPQRPWTSFQSSVTECRNSRIMEYYKFNFSRSIFKSNQTIRFHWRRKLIMNRRQNLWCLIDEFCVMVIQSRRNRLIKIQIANVQLISLPWRMNNLNVARHDDDTFDWNSKLINRFHCPPGVYAIAVGYNLLILLRDVIIFPNELN